MRRSMPLLLAPVGLLLGDRCSYRWCRRCLKRSLAFHSKRRVRQADLQAR